MIKRTRNRKPIGIAIALALMLPLPIYLLASGGNSATESRASEPDTQTIQTAVQAHGNDDDPNILTDGISTSAKSGSSTPENQTLTTYSELSETGDDTFSITISKIDLHQNISPKVDPANKEEYLPILEHNIAHGKATAFPSASNGNTYLFAHSKKRYDGITPKGGWFTRIDELRAGDTIKINYHGKIHIYTVTTTAIIDPTDTYVYTGNSLYEDHRSLTLQTCYPRGETDLRLLVYAIGE